jgi:membrane protease YdiL (CAAX protease family)
MDSVHTPAAPEPHRESEVWRRSIYLTVPVVMLIAVAPYTRLIFPLYQALRALGVNEHLWQISEAGVHSVQVALLVLIVLFWEERPLASCGMLPPELSDLKWGVLAFMIIVVAGRVLWSPGTLPPESVKSAQAQLDTWASLSGPWKIILAISASFFEELYFRGYVIERVEEITGSMALGAIVGTALDLYIHSVYWETSFLISIALDQFSLALLYLWRRSVASCTIAHVLIDVVR